MLRMHILPSKLPLKHWTKNRICPKFAWCKYVANMKFAKLCNQCKGGDGRIRTKASKFGHHHTSTGCKAHICNIFAQGKFYANSFFRPVKRFVITCRNGFKIMLKIYSYNIFDIASVKLRIFLSI